MANMCRYIISETFVYVAIMAELEIYWGSFEEFHIRGVSCTLNRAARPYITDLDARTNRLHVCGNQKLPWLLSSNSYKLGLHQ